MEKLYRSIPDFMHCMACITSHYVHAIQYFFVVLPAYVSLHSPFM